mgnify:FL=1
MVISTIRMAIPVAKHNDALSILRPMAMQSRDDKGCLGYSVYRDIEDDNVLMIQGRWKSEENMGQHIRSEEYRNLLLVLEMSLKKPEIRFDTVSSSTGIETIEEIRNAVHMG